MNSLTNSPLGWRDPGASVWPGALTPPVAPPADLSAGRQTAAWFNEPLPEASRVLRAPVQPAGDDGTALAQRFLGCLLGPGAA